MELLKEQESRLQSFVMRIECTVDIETFSFRTAEAC